MDAEAIARLFARPVLVSIATPSMFDAVLYPEERAAVAKAIERRRREFAAGRACARAALGKLGAPAAAIPVGPDRAPIWPDGFVGSITHCDGFCCAVAARASEIASVGVDAEDAGPMTPGAARLVLQPGELARASAAADPPGSSWAKLAFSAKEAVYKCWFPLTGTPLTFQDLWIDFAESGEFDVRIATPLSLGAAGLHRFEGRWMIAGGRVYAGVTATIASSAAR
jgi:4'-phosphopantetheinyl transferase EntD